MMTAWRQKGKIFFEALRHHWYLSIPFIILAACMWLGYINPNTLFLLAVTVGIICGLLLFCVMYVIMSRHDDDNELP